MSIKSERNFLMGDMLIVLASVAVAIFSLKTGFIAEILISTRGFELLESFIAGMFFTSIFTTAPAIAALGEIGNANGIFHTAIFGAFGALIGDLIIFRFIRDRLSGHFLELIQHKRIGKKIRVLLSLKYFRWFTFLLAGLVIASPLPDELGIGLLGLSRMRVFWFIPLSLTFNFLGILLIGTIARTL